MIKLDAVRIRQEEDDCPDFSYLGEWTDDLKPGIIIRKYGQFYEKLSDDTEIPEKGREYRGFLPYAGGEEVGTEDYYKYGLQDWNRMEDYGKTWWHYNIYAEADVVVNGVCQKIRSGGLHGVESDSDEAHFREVREEELHVLKKILEEMNVDLSLFEELAEQASKSQ